MNNKVVVVWIIVMILFFIVGIYGYVNRDLLKNDYSNEPFVPTSSEDNTKTCQVILNNGVSSYSLTLENNLVTKVSATFKATEENIDLYQAASNINTSLSGDGYKVTLSGDTVDFSLSVIVDLSSANLTLLNGVKSDLDKLSINIESNLTYDAYQEKLKSINEYTCN